jgi:hypothetical protein
MARTDGQMGQRQRREAESESSSPSPHGHRSSRFFPFRSFTSSPLPFLPSSPLICPSSLPSPPRPSPLSGICADGSRQLLQPSTVSPSVDPHVTEANAT